MEEKGITQYALIKRFSVSLGQITRLKRNESVSTHTIETLCRILSCRVEDVMEYIGDEMKFRRKEPLFLRLFLRDSGRSRGNPDAPQQKKQPSCQDGCVAFS